MGIFRVGIVRVGVILGGNFPGWDFSGWELSGGNHPGGNFSIFMLNPDWMANKQLNVNLINPFYKQQKKHLKEIRILEFNFII